MIDNPIFVTFTEKQVIRHDFNKQLENSFERSIDNFRHFKNLLNRKVFKKSYHRYSNKQLKMFVVHEKSKLDRHHIHSVIEKPEWFDEQDYETLIRNLWDKSDYGYRQIWFDQPPTDQDHINWVRYCLKETEVNDRKFDDHNTNGWINLDCTYLG